MNGSDSKLIFLSGPSGAGKTTLVNKLKERGNIFVPELETNTKELYWGKLYEGEVNHYHRQSLKIAQRALENEEVFAKSRQFQGITLGDRCISDDRAYSSAMRDLGWVSDEEFKKLDIIRQELYRNELKFPLCIVINPDYQVCLENVSKRVANGGKKKFMNDNVDFMRAVCDNFKSLEGVDNIFYVDRLVDDSIADEIYEWMRTV